VKKTLVWCMALLCACSSSSSSHNQNPNCQPGTGTTLNASCGPGFSKTAPNRPGTIEVTFSGEQLGESGLPFTGNPADTNFVDGWSMTFDEILVVLGNFRLAPGATQSPDQRQVGNPVATMPGPYVVDMHKPSSFGIGADGQEPAGSIFKWDTDDGGNAFDNNTRYSFSYDVMQAKYPATQVNLTADQFADYALMVQNGWSKLYRGTATFTGSGTPYPDPAVQVKFAALPTPVHFMFGWNDAGSHINCNNPDFGTGQASRGVQPNSNGAVIAQVTMHVDHVFWDILKEHTDVKLRFDPIAAWAPANTTAANPFDLRTIATKPLLTTFSDKTPMPDRGPQQTTVGLGYTCGGTRPCAQVTPNLNGVPAGNIPGLANFMAFSAQSQMHMGADGLCYDVGQNAADPFFVPGI